MSAPPVSDSPDALPLRIEALVKHFGSLTAVDSISLELRAGESLGLLGPNGAGKSTLIRSIVGRVLADSGTVSIFGQPAGSPAARMSIGWVPQDLALYPRLTCAENLLAFGRYHGLSGSALREAVKWGLNWASLEDRKDERVKNLSGGMKRRLNMAAGMIHRPRLVLMDEPTVGVDPQSRNRIFEMIEALHGEGISLIYTTHYMEEAERLCDRIAIVDHGKIIALGTAEELVQASFASRNQVEARFSSPTDEVAAWATTRSGVMAEETAVFSVEHPTEIAGILESATQAGLDLTDVRLQRPNLESVFLHLTGRDLRE
ncbi:MAG TPA: ABC transporter ATP-binding protein [Granulicella sp.]